MIPPVKINRTIRPTAYAYGLIVHGSGPRPQRGPTTRSRGTTSALVVTLRRAGHRAPFGALLPAAIHPFGRVGATPPTPPFY